MSQSRFHTVRHHHAYKPHIKQDGFGVGAGNKFNHAALTAVMMNFSS